MNSSELDAVVGRGLDFLRRSQLPWGEFKVYMTVIDYAETDGVLDSCVFPTALIAYSLGFDDSGASREMLDKSVRFLLGEMEGPGLWRYWTKRREYQATIADWEKLHMFQYVMPPDLDDIACVSYVLRREGVPFPSNLKLIFANRDPGGLFYTWLTLRWPPPLMPAYLRTVLPQWRHPLMLPAYWKLTPSMPDDVDCVVNANVLFYAGAGREMRPVVEYLIDVARRGEGHRCDKWHRNRFMFHYVVSRNFDAGVAALGDARDASVAGIIGAAKPDGAIGDNAADTALAVCALLSWGSTPPELERAVRFLLESQRADGSWPRTTLWYGGPQKHYGWGSEELTTGFCLEALLRYRQTCSASRAGHEGDGG
jgi:hypothetical protein